jgi:ABC-2 type transport system ATP-binding protein
MWRFLRNINDEGTTIILTTHYLEEAESLCRHVAIIDEGQIIVNDRMSAVLRKLAVETLVFNLAENLNDLPRVDGYHLRLTDPVTLEVDVPAERGVNDLFAALSRSNIRVLSMRNKANRLEELFMRLVDNKQAAHGAADSTAA